MSNESTFETDIENGDEIVSQDVSKIYIESFGGKREYKKDEMD